jgi:hypothetical protein
MSYGSLMPFAPLGQHAPPDTNGHPPAPPAIAPGM